jgi:hypothetical protein
MLRHRDSSMSRSGNSFSVRIYIQCSWAQLTATSVGYIYQPPTGPYATHHDRYGRRHLEPLRDDE